MTLPILFRTAALACFGAAAAFAAPTVTVAKFLDDRAGALAFTFDDALPSQHVYAAPALAEVGFKATFYIITANIIESDAAPAMGKATTWKQWKALLDAGHEIGSHTVTHRNLNILSAAEAETELSKSRQVIQEKLGIIPVTLAYPYAAPNAAVLALARKYYPYTRITSVGYGDAPGFAKTAADMDKYADDAVANKRFDAGLIHGLTEPYAPMDPAVFKQHLQHCKTLVDQGKLWVASFLDISEYAAGRDMAHINVESQSATGIVFQMTYPVDPIVNPDLPLTLIITTDGATPGSATAIRTSNAKPLPVTVQPGRILVRAPMGAGMIKVDWSGSAVAPVAAPRLKAKADPMHGRRVNGRKVPMARRPSPAR